jgi:hypothetical protein
MRTLFALTVFAMACGGSAPKKESSLVNDPEAAPTCCCKTVPTTAEKEIIPNYTMTGRMECSGMQGDCVDDVQCAASQGGSTATSTDGVPPPPDL